MSLAGLHVLSLESRKAKEMEVLIARESGIPFVAPSVKERAVDSDDVALRFVEQLEAGEFDMVICMTGAGLTFMRDQLATRMDVERFAQALRRVTVVSRGPKPVVVLRSLGVPVHITIPEPNTWKEIVTAVAGGKQRRIAVQEYGRPSLEMKAALEQLGATVTPVAVYRWELPDDLGPLREAVRRLAAGEIDVVLFTSSIQLDHLLEVASVMKLDPQVNAALARRTVNASIGPVMTASLEAHHLPVDVTPRHPKMWALVKAASEHAAGILATAKARA